jgi:sulfate permease, SulP family
MGVAVAVVVLFASLSFGTLIFAGDLSSGVADGIGIALISAAIVGLVVAFRSSYPATIAIPQDRVAPILALMAAEVAAAMPVDALVADKVINVLAAIALTSVFSGAVLYMLGRYRLGNLTRFIPYPVIGGFLSGSGWLLVVGSLRVMTGQKVSLANLPKFFEPGILKLWLPGIALGGFLFFALRWFKQTKLLPMILVGSVVVFYGVVFLTGTTADMARKAGWLAVIRGNGNFHPHLWDLHARDVIDVYAIGHVAGLAATVLFTAVISILLNSSALELAVQSEIDLNQELRAAGIANLAGGILGGMLGFQSLSLSRLANDLGSRNRAAGIVSALVCGLVFFAGPPAFEYLPKFALGGLLFYVGLGFLAEWLYDSWSRFLPSDYAVVVLIVAVMSAFGYLQGVGLGVLAAVFLFIHYYSRVGVITHVLTGAEFQSNVDRPVSHQRTLKREGGSVHVMKLQGFIFFGTANTLLHNIRSRALNSALPPLKCVILDFRRVSGLDSSAALSLAKAGRFARKIGFRLLLTQVPQSMEHHLQRGLVQEETGEWLSFFPDLDHALESWENRILADHGLNGSTDRPTLREQLTPYWPNPNTLVSFIDRLERRTLPESNFLIRQGDFADELYFIESGEVTTMLEGVNGSPPRRLRRQGGGTVLGEIGLLLKVPRTASVLVLSPVAYHTLTEASLERLKKERPDVAADFYEFLSRYLSERVLTATQSLRVLID